MPFIEDNDFHPTAPFRNPHFTTAWANVFRRIPLPPYTREQLATLDGDFISLDWVRNAHPRLVIISHGLEGSSRSAHVRALVKVLSHNGFDCLAWNYRGCGGEMNRVLRCYHSGATDDLKFVINHAVQQPDYKEIFLAGVSLGGNLVLKFLGDEREEVKNLKIKGAACLSVPCDLAASAKRLNERRNAFYQKIFLKSLKAKLRKKQLLFPRDLDLSRLGSIRSIMEYDDFYTAPVHGFSGVGDYYARCSSTKVLSGIRVPTLLLNALDDPMLPGSCHPRELAQESEYLTLRLTRCGGHVGFCRRFKEETLWSEENILRFFKSLSLLFPSAAPV